ncbi:MAG: hypothetical protein GY870_18990 [archaeon]|nr:hypothetical protein [archaeon]
MPHNPKHKKRKALPSNADKVGRTKLASNKLGKKCSIDGCNKESIHTLSKEIYDSALNKAELELKTAKGVRKFNICKEHYKAVKAQKRKEDKKIKPKYDKGNVKKIKQGKIQNFLE